jgi:hypothetical protein
MSIDFDWQLTVIAGRDFTFNFGRPSYICTGIFKENSD